MKKYSTKWMRIVSIALPGAWLASCATDLRDSVLTGAMDYVSGTITDTATNAVPIAEFLGRVWDTVFTNIGI